jgi:hypothetical protein
MSSESASQQTTAAPRLYEDPETGEKISKSECTLFLDPLI